MGAAARRILQRGWSRRGAIALVLRPLSILYGLLWRIRKALYRTGVWQVQRVNVPVIVIGNVVVGGAGKTPLVMALVQHLHSLGIKPGVLSRGYGRERHDCRAVEAGDLAQDVGDEPLLIRHATGAPVQVARRRIDAARALLARHPEVEVLVCDDGLQHLELHRDVEICVLDADGIGNGLLLPAGPLREPWPRPVDLTVQALEAGASGGFRVQRRLAGHALRADGSQISFEHLRHCGATIHAVAAIARPEAFFSMLRAQGLDLQRTDALPDHADFTALDWAEAGSDVLLCTEKDAAKLWRQRPDALAVPLEVQLDPQFWRELDRLLVQRGGTALQAKLSSGHGHPPS